MKKSLSLILCICVLLSLCACSPKKGDISKVKIDLGESEIYSEDDIQSAIDVILADFEKDWEGCELKMISYAGDEESQFETDYYLGENKYYDADEAIVLVSDFYARNPSDNSGLNSPFDYNGWSWILVRTEGGTWRHVDHGYG